MIAYQWFVLVLGSEMSDDNRRKCPKSTASCPMGAVPKEAGNPISGIEQVVLDVSLDVLTHPLHSSLPTDLTADLRQIVGRYA